MARKKPQSEIVQALNSTTLSYQQCEWLAGTERCKYPGSISTNTHEGGPYFCRLHFGCSDAAFGAQIVEASRDYRHPTQDEIEAAHLERVKASLKAKGLERKPGESVKAWMQRTRQWMREQSQGWKRFGEHGIETEEAA